MENILRNYPISKGTMVYVFNDQNNGQIIIFSLYRFSK